MFTYLAQEFKEEVLKRNLYFSHQNIHFSIENIIYGKIYDLKIDIIGTFSSKFYHSNDAGWPN